MSGRSYDLNADMADGKAERVSRKHEDLPEDQKVAGEDRIHYGKKFAKTEELYAAHQMERQLEELAREDGMLEEEHEAEEETEQPGRREPGATPRAESSRIEEVTRGAPIGATPTTAEPPPRQGFSEVIGDAQRYASMIREAIKDLTTASLRLMRLPVELAVLAAQRLRPLRS